MTMSTTFERAQRVKVAVDKAVANGYVHLTDGVGSQNDALEYYRAQGYDVKGWYIKAEGGEQNWTWTMYGKMKGQRRHKIVLKTTEQIRAELEANNVKVLRDMCKSKSIKGYGKMSKQQMIEALTV